MTSTGQEPTLSVWASASVKSASASASRPPSTAAIPATNGAFAGSTTLARPRIAASAAMASPSPRANEWTAEFPASATERSLRAISSATAVPGAE
ncbi:hypothetical protein [Mycobacterium sp. E2462]|uniref:hypothetical protein n=1 Tax=Mycobacterium sp. E2462 TaxID=1834133 RepID=UPI0012EACD9B|nr:hypothetical protein [Mycobacterium sp. E2462]